MNQSLTNTRILQNKMILIFGKPRSGTTWLGKIFDSHPDIIYLHEPDTELQLKDIPMLVPSEIYPHYKEIIRIYCSGLLDKCTIRVNGKTPFFNKSYLSGIKYLVFKLNFFEKEDGSKNKLLFLRVLQGKLGLGAKVFSQNQ